MGPEVASAKVLSVLLLHLYLALCLRQALAEQGRVSQTVELLVTSTRCSCSIDYSHSLGPAL